jgi:hypothetical protein
MAAEFEPILSEYLARLPDGPDRRFLTGLQQTVQAYVEQHAASTPQLAGVIDAVQAPWQPTESAMAAPASPTEPAPAHEEQQEADAPLPVEAAEEPKQWRVHLRGRLGAKPLYKALPRGGRRGYFPLYEHPPENPDAAVRYDIYTFNKPGKPYTDRLEALKLGRGDFAEVIGYARAGGANRDGTPKPTLVYAAAPVKTR